jgi:hypothetical protein
MIAFRGGPINRNDPQDGSHRAPNGRGGQTTDSPKMS